MLHYSLDVYLNNQLSKRLRKLGKIQLSTTDEEKQKRNSYRCPGGKKKQNIITQTIALTDTLERIRYVLNDKLKEFEKSGDH